MYSHAYVRTWRNQTMEMQMRVPIFNGDAHILISYFNYNSRQIYSSNIDR